MNFLIPELVSGIQYRKGTYAAESGDFSAAGAIRVNYLNVLDATAGPRRRRSLRLRPRARGGIAEASARAHLLVAAEAHGQRRPVGSS